MLKAFASFGFCKAHAAAFALPTYQSAWLKAHHPAAFLAGVLTHDPGMYPKRLILDDARSLGIAVLGPGRQRQRRHLPGGAARPVGRAAAGHPGPARRRPGAGRTTGRARARTPDLPDGRAYGIRLSLADVKGISEAEVRADRRRPPVRLARRLLAPRAGLSRPVVERLVVAGGFDSLYGLGGLAARLPVRRRGSNTN